VDAGDAFTSNKAAGSEDGHSPLSTDEDKNKWSYPTTTLYGLNRVLFIFDFQKRHVYPD
jgi:hypothetical protein